VKRLAGEAVGWVFLLERGVVGNRFDPGKPCNFTTGRGESFPIDMDYLHR